VEIPEIVVSCNNLVSSRCNPFHTFGGDPALNKRILRERNLPLQKHFLPNDGREFVLMDLSVRMLNKPCNKRLDNFGIVSLYTLVKSVRISIDLVTSGMVVGCMFG